MSKESITKTQSVFFLGALSALALHFLMLLTNPFFKFDTWYGVDGGYFLFVPWFYFVMEPSDAEGLAGFCALFVVPPFIITGWVGGMFALLLALLFSLFGILFSLFGTNADRFSGGVSWVIDIAKDSLGPSNKQLAKKYGMVHIDDKKWLEHMESKALLDRPISDLHLSDRVHKCMASLQLNTIRELTRKTGADLLKCKNFGVKSLDEVREKLSDAGLKLRGD